MSISWCFFFQAEDGIRDLVRSRGLGDVYKRQSQDSRFAVNSGGVGMLPAEYLIGRADRIMFSSAGLSLIHI